MYLDFQKMGKYVALSSQSISSIHKNLCGFHKANNDRDADAAFIYLLNDEQLGIHKNTMTMAMTMSK